MLPASGPVYMDLEGSIIELYGMSVSNYYAMAKVPVLMWIRAT